MKRRQDIMNALAITRVLHRTAGLALGLSIALWTVHQTLALEAPPERMTYQGFVVDGNGMALGNSSPQNYEVIFRIYTEQSAGDLLWSEQQTVTMDKGYMSVLLGEGADAGTELRPALSTVFAGATASERYISLTVKGIGVANADVDILPRLRLVSAPFAYMAATATKVVNNAVASAQIADNTLTVDDIGASAVGSSEVINNSLTVDDIGPNSVGSSEVINNSLTVNDIGPSSVGSDEVIDNSLTSSDLGPNSVGSSEVVNDSLTSSDLGDSSVGTSEIANYSISSSDVGSGAVNSYGIANDSITWTDLSKASLGSPPLVKNYSWGTAYIYQGTLLSDAQTKEYLADDDGGTIKLILTRASDGYVYTINEHIAINATTGRGYTAQTGGQVQPFVLKDTTVHNIIPTPWNLVTIQDQNGWNVLGSTGSHGTPFTDLRLTIYWLGTWSVKAIIYDQ
jgi:hypothetical protein